MVIPPNAQDPAHQRPEFRNREAEIADILAPDQKTPVLTLFGVGGIGKTCLLKEAARRIGEKKGPARPAVVVYVDFADLPVGTPQELLQAIIEQAREHLPETGQDAEQMAEEVVARLGRLAAWQDVYLMFDSTERFQAEQGLWRWLELHLVDPLVAETKTRLVFAGRVPAPWRSYVVRRAVRRRSLDPLPRERAAIELLEDCLRIHGHGLNEKAVQSTVPLLYNLSFGHPLLSERLAERAAQALGKDPTPSPQLEDDLRHSVVEDFVRNWLFEGLDEPWPEILIWASVLDEFDAYTLEQYTARLPQLQALVTDVPPNFFNLGIAEMRNQHALVWQSGRGYAVHGILRDIVRNQFKALHPQQFKDACRAAAETYDVFATVQMEESEAQAYRDKAAAYERRAHHGAKENQS